MPADERKRLASLQATQHLEERDEDGGQQNRVARDERRAVQGETAFELPSPTW